MSSETQWIPVIEGDVATTPMAAVDAVCEWCNIRLKAIPDRPTLIRSAWYHPDCGAIVQRVLARLR